MCEKIYNKILLKKVKNTSLTLLKIKIVDPKMLKLLIQTLYFQGLAFSSQ